ncbi:hypothetical protein LTR37_003104 [Vermiconidia calcicola]|uniref:Uncharacterized protein n=1 Tax=Vermiconidia calcicola TaxID=1690605 RepID=A0ACC3NR27_9PEZI|nr:hypothetical protein LTR37_003104 [Vermiconidia calcicola]
MADVAPSTQPRNIPNAGLTVEPVSSLGIPPSARSFRTSNLTLDTFSPVTQNGSFEFDRIIKQGGVLKRTRKTKSWKPIFMVLRPHILSIYRDKNETKLRHQINLSDLTAVARQKDPKRKEKHIFGLFSPARNYHLEALSDQEAQEWVEVIRRAARLDQREEEMFLASPGGAHTTPYQGFERSIDAHISPGTADERTTAPGYASSSDAAEGLSPSQALPKTRRRENTNTSTTTPYAARHPSYAEYSGADCNSFSDFSDAAGPTTARLSALSLAQTDPRPSTSSTHAPQIYGSSAPARPSMSARNASQMSVGAFGDEQRRAQNPSQYEEERVVHQGWTYLLKSKSGVRQWKKVWLVVRPKGLALYKNEEEYAALLVLSLEIIIDAVDVDPISRSKRFCMQILTEEKNYRFCALDEESLTRCLGALKSLVAKKKARRKEKEGVTGVAPVAINS